MSILSTRLPLLFLILFIFLFSTHHQEATAALGRKVGGRTQVKDVENNKDVQNLGRFCVQEYNLRQQANTSLSKKKKLLSFSRVVEAETQVVSGIKYYLRISASNANFDAVVVVKPWMHSKELIGFTPSTPRSNTK